MSTEKRQKLVEHLKNETIKFFNAEGGLTIKDLDHCFMELQAALTSNLTISFVQTGPQQ